jgi:hypothetical protein
LLLFFWVTLADLTFLTAVYFSVLHDPFGQFKELPSPERNDVEKHSGLTVFYLEAKVYPLI